MTLDEKIEIIKRAKEAERNGDEEGYLRIRSQIPLSPHIAMAAKEVYGVEYLKNSGIDLSEAEAEYGKDWLSK